MPTRDSAPLGAPCWIDLLSSDPERAKDFYGQLFGWTAEQGGEELGHYVTFSKGDAVVAGMMKNQGDSGLPDAWSTYLASADAKATSEAAAASGGQVIVEPMDVMDLGTMAFLVDSGGAAIGIWQPGTHKGFAVVGEAGAPVWHELHTRDYSGTVSFYERVFDWKTAVLSDTDEFRYTQLVDADGTPLAGIMDATAYQPEGVPAAWQVYLGVEDVDATLATVDDLGGAVLEPAQDTPFGRLAKVADPTGAVFKVASPPS
jgi:uncharacterized protein